jgi:hypothetical protein
MQRPAGAADSTLMTALTTEAWFAIGTIIALCVIGSLYVLASIVRDASRRIELYEKVAVLRIEYAARIRDIQARGYKIENAYEAGEFDLVESAPAEKKAA